MTTPLSTARPPRGSVAITGMGMLTPLGNDFATVSDALMAGRSGVREIGLADTSL